MLHSREFTAPMTVRGPVPPADLGIVAINEHLLFGLPGWQDDPWVAFDRPRAFDFIAAALEEFKEAGGKTVVDGSGTLLGRDAEMLANLSSSAGVQIIASTGLASQDRVPGHFLIPLSEREAPEQPKEAEKQGRWVPGAGYLAEMFYNEMAEGMVAPGMIRTAFKAGLFRAECSWHEITEIEEMSVRGAALAAGRAGASVIVDGVNQARRLLDMMMAEGLAPDRIVIGHCDDGRAIDLDRDKEIAGKGAYVAYDHVGWAEGAPAHVLPDDQRADMVKEMVDAGLTERVLLSCGAIGYDIAAARPRHSFGHLLTSFVPRLKKAGVGDDAVDTILVANPRRVLAGDGRA